MLPALRESAAFSLTQDRGGRGPGSASGASGRGSNVTRTLVILPFSTFSSAEFIGGFSITWGSIRTPGSLDYATREGVGTERTAPITLLSVIPCLRARQLWCIEMPTTPWGPARPPGAQHGGWGLNRQPTGVSPGALHLVALRADLIAVLGVAGQCHAAQRCPPWREPDSALRHHRAVRVQLAAVRITIGAAGDTTPDARPQRCSPGTRKDRAAVCAEVRCINPTICATVVSDVVSWILGEKSLIA